MKPRTAIALCLMAVGVVQVASAQTTRQRQPEQFEITSKMSEAMRFMSTNPELALDILRRLNTQYPGRERIVSRVGYVFQVLGKADRATSTQFRRIGAG